MEELLAEISAFQAIHEMSDRDFGRRSIGDHNLLFDLRGERRDGKPRSPSLSTVEKIRSFMRGYVAEQAQAA